MPKIKYSESQGLVQSAGAGVSLDDLPYTTVQPKTTAFTIAQPGVFTVSGTSALAVTMPAASSFPGGLFTVRGLSNWAHFVTASASEAQGTKVFKAPITGTINNTTGQQDQGWKLALAPIVGSSVTLYCDGLSYLVLASSGSLSVSNPTS